LGAQGIVMAGLVQLLVYNICTETARQSVLSWKCSAAKSSTWKLKTHKTA